MKILKQSSSFYYYLDFNFIKIISETNLSVEALNKYFIDVTQRKFTLWRTKEAVDHFSEWQVFS